MADDIAGPGIVRDCGDAIGSAVIVREDDGEGCGVQAGGPSPGGSGEVWLVWGLDSSSNLTPGRDSFSKMF